MRQLAVFKATGLDADNRTGAAVQLVPLFRPNSKNLCDLDGIYPHIDICKYAPRRRWHYHMKFTLMTVELLTGNCC